MIMNRSIHESHTTPVRYTCDVCVAGGGVAGIAAAISAARAGRAVGKPCEVILLERGFLLGGLATAGLVTIYLPICDGRGHQISYGLAEELLRLSIEHGAEARYPTAWLEGGTEEERARTRFEVQFNAQLFAISAEQLLLREGVRILYGAVATDCVTEGGRITHVVIEGKGGREAIAVSRAVVDTTGDADLCRLAGAEVAEFSEGNKLAAWYYGVGDGALKLYMCGVHDVPDTVGNTELPDTRRFRGLETEELSELVSLSHASLLHNLLMRRKEVPSLVPVTISTIPTVRMTRRLVGAYTQDVAEERASYSDSVGTFPSWRKRGPVYELPFRTLYGNTVYNLLTAGRSISVTEAMWDLTRAIPVCAVSGEAAGAAAALGDDMRTLDVTALQAYLTAAGVRLHPEA